MSAARRSTVPIAALLVVVATAAQLTVPPTPAAERVAAAPAVSCGADILGEAQAFNVFVHHDYTVNAIGVGGRVGVGGNATVDSYGVGQSLPPDPSRVDLMVKDLLSVGPGGAGAWSGAVTYGSLSLANPYGLGALAQGPAPPPFSFDTSFANLVQQSQRLAALPPTASISGPLNGTRLLRGDDPELNVFSLPASDLQRTQVIRIRVPSSSTTIVNVTGSSFTTTQVPTVAVELWDGSSYQQPGDTPSTALEQVRTKLLWNLPTATSVQIGPSISWQGSVLAAHAEFSFGSGSLYGTIVADALHGVPNGANGSARDHRFVGCVPAPAPRVQPFVQCVETLSNGTRTAYFGYDNPGPASVSIPVGASNAFSPEPADRGQPEQFEPGRHENAFATGFGDRVTWRLGASSATADASSDRCEGSIRIDHALVPTDDSGRFDLLLDGETVASTVGNNGTSGAQVVSAGPSGTTHSVAVRAALGTTAADYTHSIACRDQDGTIVAEADAASLNVTIVRGQVLVCAAASTRIDVPPEPTPAQADLMITKTGRGTVSGRPAVVVGERITWSVTITNQGPDAATRVVVDDALPSGVAYVAHSLELAPGVVCNGSRCTIDALDPGATLTIRFETVATSVGVQTNTVTVRSDDVDDPNPANNVASARVAVGSGLHEQVTPTLACVETLAGGQLIGHFGYTNASAEAVAIPIVRNRFAPPPEDRGQPTLFQPGHVVDAFQADVGDGATWTVGQRSVHADASSPPCAATIRVDKSLAPLDDPGRFDLTVDSTVTAHGVGDGGSSGDYRVGALPGSVTPHTVGELGADGTSLYAYDTTIVCRGDGGAGPVVAEAAGPAIVVAVSLHDAIVCTISNSRRPAPITIPPIPPEPPLVPTPPPPLEPLPLPPLTPGADLRVTQTVQPATLALGGTATWTTVVANVGSLAAAEVSATFSPPDGTVLRELTTATGTCSTRSRRCSLGTLAPGASVRIVARTLMQRTGNAVGVARATSASPLVNLADDVASAEARVTHAYDPPLAARCGSIAVSPPLGQAGATLRLRASVRSLTGTALPGARVDAHGAGASATARTDAAGVAVLALTPLQAGQLQVVARGQETSPAARCAAQVRVTPAQRTVPAVTG